MEAYGYCSVSQKMWRMDIGINRLKALAMRKDYSSIHYGRGSVLLTQVSMTPGGYPGNGARQTGSSEGLSIYR